MWMQTRQLGAAGRLGDADNEALTGALHQDRVYPNLNAPA
jgi:hypothetical protein